MHKLIASVLALTLFAAACGGAEGVVATVDGNTISLDDVRSMTNRETTVQGEEFREILSRLVILEALESGLQKDLGLTIDEEEVDLVYQSLLDNIQAQGLTIEEALGQPGANEETLRFNARVTVLRNLVTQAELDDPSVVEALMEQPGTITTVCVRHILVETLEEIEAVAQRLEDGEEFGAVADEVSLDTGTEGGDLGCSFASRYVAPFADASMTAAIGELTYPVETQFGQHLLIVDDRTTPTADELREDIREYITADEVNTLWVEWLNERLDEADIQIESRYGTWSPGGLGILPPE